MSRRDRVIFTCLVAFLFLSVSFYVMSTDNSQWPVFDKYRKMSSSNKSPSTPTSSTECPPQKEQTQKPVLPECRNFPKDISDIMLVMKTGATAAFDRLPIHLMTTLQCVDDFLLFSDMEQTIGTHKIHNALDEVAVETKKDNHDFVLYRKLQEYRKLGGNPLLLKSENNGWNLDKYKFIHMLLKAHRMRPDAPWYFFVEADTYFNWENLVTFLHQLSSKKPYYIGSNSYLGSTEFAHGGTGYIISNSALKKLIESPDDVAGIYTSRMKDVCCGDAIVAEALRDSAGVRMTKAWPMMNGEKPFTIPYRGEQWCQPVITMHHVNPIEVADIWSFEQERRNGNETKSPILIRDLFYKFVSPHLIPMRDEWDNLSDEINYGPPKRKEDYRDDEKEETFDGKHWDELSDIQKNSFHSFDECKKACEANNDCLTFRFSKKECSLDRRVRFGEKQVKPSDDDKKKSGWLVDRIREREKVWGKCDRKVKWDYYEPY